MIMRKIAIFSFLFIALGCVKESSTSYTVKLLNSTIHRIEVIPYQNGSIGSSGSIILMADTEFTIANGSRRGIENQGGFDSKYFSSADSVKVIFDDSFTIIHYFSDLPSSPAERYYDYKSNRNLLNLYSYGYSFEDKSKYSRLAFYTYTFTEKDYLDAKE